MAISAIRIVYYAITRQNREQRDTSLMGIVGRDSRFQNYEH